MRVFALFCCLILSACGAAVDPPQAEGESAPTEDLVDTPGSLSATFVGSQRCAGCHTEEYAFWLGSHHELAMQPATATSVLADFDDVEIDYYGETTRFRRDGDRFVVETAGADGKPAVFEISHAFGVAPLQQYLVTLADGRKQALTWLWDSRPSAEGGQRWYHLYPDEHIAPGDPLHWTGRYFNWNTMCAECHSTDLKVNYDAVSDTFATTFSEMPVGCEACHGPGSAHIELVDGGPGTHSAESLPASGFPVDLDDLDGA